LGLKQIDMNKYTFFWGGPFSQWAPSNFVVNEIKYNCAEQYMMAHKASVFDDYDTYIKIMESKHPNDQKQLGRGVKNFDKEKWEKVCKQIVFDGNYAKFTQNPHLWDALESTVGTELVEASPFDTIWGIGLAENDPLALNKETWKGLNWLGEIITDVREVIIIEKTHEST
jgi:ribA/ribD-fused uncharacterized protein